MSYNTKVYMEQGGDKLVVKSGGQIDMLTGAQLLINGTQGAHIADVSSAIAITYTSGTAKTAVNAQTVADRSTPTDAEVMDLFDEVNASLGLLDAKVNAILARLEAAGINASS